MLDEQAKGPALSRTLLTPQGDGNTWSISASSNVTQLSPAPSLPRKGTETIKLPTSDRYSEMSRTLLTPQGDGNPELLHRTMGESYHMSRTLLTPQGDGNAS